MPLCYSLAAHTVSHSDLRSEASGPLRASAAEKEEKGACLVSLSTTQPILTGGEPR